MKLGNALLLSSSLAFAALAFPGSASACGGCFISQTESTQVSGHRMILSVGMDATTLWDQISYAGNPESFAWVLPIKGTVEVGLSSDALFQVLDDLTRVIVVSPSICPNSCGNSYGYGPSVDNDASESDGKSGVEVLKQEVVGPYETVQLAASDPGALTDWLTSHGYAIPDDIQPIVDAYVSADFNFLALKLVPGEGVNSMRPVRVTSPGAGLSLPLRMVAAGTGAVTPINLWVFGEGRYEPANFPSFEMKAEDVVWDWDTQSSNYAALRTEKFEASSGFAWLIESAWPWYYGSLGGWLGYGEALESYANPDGTGAQENLEADMKALTGALDPNSLWLVRMSAELSRKALQNDLQVGASLDQNYVSNYIQVTQTIGTLPEPPNPCPPDPCGEGSEGTGEGGPTGDGTDNPPNFPSQSAGNGAEAKAGGACSLGGGADGSSVPVLAAGLSMAVALLRRLGQRRKA